MSGEADLEEAIINELERQGCAYGGVDTGALAVALLSQECIQNSDSEVRNMQQSSDMVYQVATALVECGIYPGGRLVGFPKDAYLTWAKAALEASHHAELVETLSTMELFVRDNIGGLTETKTRHLRSMLLAVLAKFDAPNLQRSYPNV
jgi:hypothetical protein